MKDIFNPNSYTEEAMPISTALCIALDSLGNLDSQSSAVKACREKYEAINDQFFDTLSEEQRKLYNDIQWGDIEITATEIREYFNRGLRFGLLLARELLL